MKMGLVMSEQKLPGQAKVVIVGGGVMGCGLAYHLAHEGWTDVVLLEKAELTSGSTWHAAGQITHSTSSFGLGKCVDYNIGLYAGALEAETGQAVTWHGCGSFRLAYSEDEMDWLRHTLSVGRSLSFHLVPGRPDRIAELHPFYNLDGVLGALHTPDDGHVDPSNVTMAMARGGVFLWDSSAIGAINALLSNPSTDVVVINEILPDRMPEDVMGILAKDGRFGHTKFVILTKDEDAASERFGDEVGYLSAPASAESLQAAVAEALDGVEDADGAQREEYASKASKALLSLATREADIGAAVRAAPDDPLERVDPSADTTFDFLVEGQSRGVENWVCGIADLYSVGARGFARAKRVEVFKAYKDSYRDFKRDFQAAYQHARDQVLRGLKVIEMLFPSGGIVPLSVAGLSAQTGSTPQLE